MSAFLDIYKYLNKTYLIPTPPDREDEMKQKWRKIDEEEEKLSLVKGFVDVWGSNFHPLSAKSVVEMVEEYLREENDSGSVKSSSSSSGSTSRALAPLACVYVQGPDTSSNFA